MSTPATTRSGARQKSAWKCRRKQTADGIGRRLSEIVVYAKSCRIDGKLTLHDLAETSEVGDWIMLDVKSACSYAVSEGWLIVRDDALTLTTVGLRAI